RCIWTWLDWKLLNDCNCSGPRTADARCTIRWFYSSCCLKLFSNCSSENMDCQSSSVVILMPANTSGIDLLSAFMISRSCFVWSEEDAGLVDALHPLLDQESFEFRGFIRRKAHLLEERSIR